MRVVVVDCEGVNLFNSRPGAKEPIRSGVDICSMQMSCDVIKSPSSSVMGKMFIFI